MIAVIDYGVGNLFSLGSSLSFLGIENKITSQKSDLQKAERIILPGVGAFPDAIQKLREADLVDVVKEEALNGKPLLGICLGMQMLFDKSYEFGEHEGLGLVKGEICPLEDDLPPGLKVPHIGWNSLDFCRQDPLLRYIKEGDYVYYVHSFYAKNCRQDTIATSEYGIDVTGIVRRGSVYGTQFHPEKSGKVGLGLLQAFAET